MLHVLVSENRLFSEILRSARRHKAITWIVPKKAAIGDDAALFVPDRGFVALGRVATTPEPTTFGNGPAYRAEIDALRALGRVVPLPEVLEVAPTWKRPTYPRSRATVPTSVESRVRRLLDSVPLGNVVGRDSLTDVPPALEGIVRETRVLLRGRSDRLRRAALERAHGICAVCEKDYSQLLEGRAVRILQVHHLAQLALAQHPRKTTLDDLAVVCPNCHAMLHLDASATAHIKTLRESLNLSQRRMEPTRDRSRARSRQR